MNKSPHLFSVTAALIRRDLSLRYRHTFLGIVWAFAQPALATCLLTLLFSEWLGKSAASYAIFTLPGVLVWQFYSRAAIGGTFCLESNAALLRHTPLPSLAVPLSVVGSAAVDFLLGFLFYLGIAPAFSPWLLGGSLVCLLLTAVGIATLFSSSDLACRDIRHLVPFISQMALLATPVFYPSSQLGDSARAFLYLNPLTGIIEGFRGGNETEMALSFLSALLLFALGIASYAKFESRVPEWI